MSQADNRGMAKDREGVAIWMSRKEWEALRLHAAQDGKTLNAYCEIVLRTHLKWREGGEKKAHITKKGISIQMQAFFGKRTLKRGFVSVPWSFLTSWHRPPFNLTPMQAMLIITVLHYWRPKWKVSDRILSKVMNISERYVQTLKASLKKKGVKLEGNWKYIWNARERAATDAALRKQLTDRATVYGFEELFIECAREHEKRL